MPQFDYVGQARTGESLTGTIESPSPERATATLAGLGVRVLSMRPTDRAPFVAPLSAEELSLFNEQLAAITKAGVALEPALTALASEVHSRKLKRLLLDLSTDLNSGLSLEAALNRQKQRFPAYYTGVVRAGLATGDLGMALVGVTRHLSLKSSVRRALVELSLYPLFVLAFGIALTSFLMRVIVPPIEDIMLEMFPPGGGAAVPVALRATLFLSHCWPTVEWIGAGIVASLILIFMLIAAPSLRRLREVVIRSIPGVRQVYWSSVLARFTQTSALAAISGTPLPELVHASGQASGSLSLARAARQVADALTKGNSLEAAVANQRAIPALWSYMVARSATTGDLPAAMAELARMYEQRAQRWIASMRLVLGPLLFTLMALMLGAIAVSLVTALAAVITGLQ